MASTSTSPRSILYEGVCEGRRFWANEDESVYLSLVVGGSARWALLQTDPVSGSVTRIELPAEVATIEQAILLHPPLVLSRTRHWEEVYARVGTRGQLAGRQGRLLRRRLVPGPLPDAPRLP